MNCPECIRTGFVSRVKTIDSRVSGMGLRRRKHCPQCGFRFSTYELTLEALNLLSMSGGGVDMAEVLNALHGALNAIHRASNPLLMDSRSVRRKTAALNQLLKGSIGEQSPPEPPMLAFPEGPYALASDRQPRDVESSDSPSMGLLVE